MFDEIKQFVCQGNFPTGREREREERKRKRKRDRERKTFPFPIGLPRQRNFSRWRERKRERETFPFIQLIATLRSRVKRSPLADKFAESEIHFEINDYIKKKA